MNKKIEAKISEVSTNQIVKKVNDFYKNNKIYMLPSTEIGLINPLYPHEFNPSFGHKPIISYLLRDKSKKEKEYFYGNIDRVLRRLDAFLVGPSERHLSFFNMIGFGWYGPKTKSPSEIMIPKVFDLLTNELEISKNKIIVTIFNGGKIKNLDLGRDESAYKVWRSFIGEKNIMLIKGRRNFIYREIEETFAGPAWEVYVDLGKNLKPLEIASSMEYKFIHRKENLLELKREHGILVGLGLERIAQFIQNKRTIFEIDTIEPLVKIVREYLSYDIELELYYTHFNTLVDRLRAIVFTISEGQSVDSTSRGKILRKFIKELIIEISYLSLDYGIISKLVNKIIQLHKNNYPNLSKVEQKIIKEINKINNESSELVILPEEKGSVRATQI